MHSSNPDNDPAGARRTRDGAATRRRGQDPCLQIQVDLSAMLDGELDPACVRRVTVHSDICPSCRGFLAGVREQAGLHRRLAGVLHGDGDAREVAALAASSRDDGGQELRRQLTVNQRKLSRVLYELGRNFTLMGLSPEFSREVALEPMPVPDAAMRGRNLLDEMVRDGAVAGSGDAAVAWPGSDWVAARELFDGRLRTPEQNLAQGQRLLTECLALDDAADDARIYLGLVHYARGQRVLARRQFQVVLDGCRDGVMRGYALTNLSNIHLDEGDFDAAIALLEQLVGSEAVARQPRLGAAVFNLALAHGLKADFERSQLWFERLHRNAPHRRRWVARELSQRSHFLHLVHTHPAAASLRQALGTWFPLDDRSRRAGGGRDSQV